MARWLRRWLAGQQWIRRIYFTLFQSPSILYDHAVIGGSADLVETGRSGEEDAETLDRVLKLDGVVAEIGCGFGRHTRHVARRCRELIAIDHSRKVLDIAKRNCGDLPNVRWIRADSRDLKPLADKSVDAAFSFGVFQCQEREDAILSLQAMRRVLRPGGRGYIEVPNLADPGNLAFYLQQAVSPVRPRSPLRTRFYVTEEIGLVCKAMGFVVLDVTVTTGDSIFVLVEKPAAGGQDGRSLDAQATEVTRPAVSRA